MTAPSRPILKSEDCSDTTPASPESKRRLLELFEVLGYAPPHESELEIFTQRAVDKAIREMEAELAHKGSKS